MELVSLSLFYKFTNLFQTHFRKCCRCDINDTGCFAAQYGKIRGSQQINFSRIGQQNTLYLIIPAVIWFVQLPTPPCSSLHSDVIRRSRALKFHYRAFSSYLVTERFLELLNLIYLSDFRGSSTILTLSSSIICWY